MSRITFAKVKKLVEAEFPQASKFRTMLREQSYTLYDTFAGDVHDRLKKLQLRTDLVGRYYLGNFEITVERVHNSRVQNSTSIHVRNIVNKQNDLEWNVSRETHPEIFGEW